MPDGTTARAYETEANALEEINRINHPNLIKSIAAFTRKDKYYFMFQWADGGNLRDFWKDQDEALTPRKSTLFLEVMSQLRGVAEALKILHHSKDEDQSWRHGDLKPENILRFTDTTILGNLRIADVGLAKRHNLRTSDRMNGTSTRDGTWRYEPPEAVTSLEDPRSRLYDIWSLGCIFLEFIIWLLYGNNELKRFNQEVQVYQVQDGPYFTLTEAHDNGNQTAEVHSVVKKWMNHISKDLQHHRNSALKMLLSLVDGKMLVVELPKDRNSKCRADAETVFQALDAICRDTAMDDGYMLSTKQILRGPLPPGATIQGGHLAPPTVAHHPQRTPKIMGNFQSNNVSHSWVVALGHFRNFGSRKANGNARGYRT